MNNTKKKIIMILIVLLTLTAFGTVYAAFTSTVTYNTNMTMPDDIMDIIGG